jgi:hypothetical protein
VFLQLPTPNSQPELVVEFTQLTLPLRLFPPSTGITSSRSKRLANKLPRLAAPRSIKSKLELRYLAFDDDYFWELIRKDYSSAWKYFERMTRI